MKMKYKILQTEEFEHWLMNEAARSRVQIAKRLENVKMRVISEIIKKLGIAFLS